MTVERNDSKSKRGQGSCPECKTFFFNRYKPQKCTSCNFHLGGTYQPKPKNPKPYAPACVFLFSSGGCKFYSVKTHAKDSRCIVIVDEESSLKQCSLEKCKNVRSTFVNSGRPELFSCEHTKETSSAVDAKKEFQLTEELIDSYACDEPTKANLLHLKESAKSPSAFQVSDNTFCVYGDPTSSNPVGYCHVRKGDKLFQCSSKDCSGFVSKTKGSKQRKICSHVHVLLCVGEKKPGASMTGHSHASNVSSDPDDQPASQSASSLGPCLSAGSSSIDSESQSSGSTANDCLPGPSTSGLSSATPLVASDPGTSVPGLTSSTDKVGDSEARSSTLKINLQRSLPYLIPGHIMKKIQEFDCKYVISDLDGDGWPKSYCPQEEFCLSCGAPLGAARPHPGQKKGECAYLLTNCVPLEPITVSVKQCLQCKGIHQVFPYQTGLFNVSDKLFVSLEILLDLREEFKRGVPPTVAMESKLAIILRKASKKIVVSTEYVTDLLYNGFYCFEAITERNLDETICGICGVLGEVYFGDGNEKNCCSRKEIVYATEDVHDDHPMPLEDFMNQIKSHWIERVTFTRNSKPFSIKASSLPPIIAPKLAGPVIWNSELKKKSAYLGDGQNKVKGDPALLHVQIRDFGLEMDSIGEMNGEELVDLCQKCGIHVGSNVSQQALRGEVQQLYATLLVGNCPCHGFTHVHGYTGGFYHLVCRHGITVASKFLTLQESVRDAADLYLSLKYPPPLFICDTPCGFVRHLDCRCKDVSEQLWGKYSGCFEIPKHGKAPTKGVSVPSLVPAEYRSSVGVSETRDNDRWYHPVTGSSRRYVLGDRFHSASNPHKSPLCNYHDINLCAQANTLKTSYQESENHRKNSKRLRSSCVQGFGTHSMYNLLMDFYQNEVIVTKQLETLRKGLPSGFQIVRDNFMRFVYVPIGQ